MARFTRQEIEYIDALLDTHYGVKPESVYRKITNSNIINFQFLEKLVDNKDIVMMLIENPFNSDIRMRYCDEYSTYTLQIANTKRVFQLVRKRKDIGGKIYLMPGIADPEEYTIYFSDEEIEKAGWGDIDFEKDA